MKVIYCFDAYCGWCFGFGSVIGRIKEKYGSSFDFEILSGGMVLPERPVPVSATAAFVKELYPQVEAMTGVKFGEDYLWHINNPELSDWFPNSEKPAIALSIVKDIYPHKAFSFAADLHHSLFEEGRDLTDDEAYRHLPDKYNLDPDEFYNLLHREEYKDKAHHDFALVKQLQVKGFPALFLQVSIDKFYLMSNGYIDFESLDKRFQNIIAEINN